MFAGQHTKQLLEQDKPEDRLGNGINLRLSVDVIPVLHKYRQRGVVENGEPGRLERLSITATRLVLAADEMLTGMRQEQAARGSNAPFNGATTHSGE